MIEYYIISSIVLMSVHYYSISPYLSLILFDPLFHRSDLGNLTLEQRWAIVALTKYTNFKQAKIANLINCDRTTIYRTMQKYSETSTVEDRDRSGRTPSVLINDNNNNIISNIINQDKVSRGHTGKEIKKEIEHQFNIQISVPTVCRLRKLLHYRPVHLQKSTQIW